MSAKSHAEWYMPTVLALERLGQQYCESEASLVYLVNSRLVWVIKQDPNSRNQNPN